MNTDPGPLLANWNTAEIVFHDAGPTGLSLTQQTSSPSGKMNRSRLRWSVPL